MKKKWYEYMLWIAYVAMVGVCVFLNLTTSFKEDTANIIVNVVMFIIVGITFLWVDFGCFSKINTIIYDLEKTTAKIKNDAMNSHTFLWEPYSRDNVELFRSKTLSSLFRDYVFELNRKPDSEYAYYRPSIDDYINGDLIDTTIHRNEMNQIAGMLTGLGILGTFIGLSLGLQNFNTGTTAEMANSIEPLMNGIKVAFHTSIYGMVFSLVFNLIFKKKLYDADAAVEAFTTSYKKYVLPDTTNDGMNQILEFQREQIGAFEDMSFRISHELSDLITPQFDRLNDTIRDFERIATQEQSEALGQVVNAFISEMNNSLSGAFSQIFTTVDEQYKIQQNNASLAQSYSASIQSIHDEIGAAMEKEEAIQAKQEKTISDFSNAIDSLKSRIIDSNDQITEALENMKAAINKFDSTVNSRGFRRGK